MIGPSLIYVDQYISSDVYIILYIRHIFKELRSTQICKVCSVKSPFLIEMS